MRLVLRSKIHKATVTEANVDYVGSITIDRDLIEKSGLSINRGDFRRSRRIGCSPWSSISSYQICLALDRPTDRPYDVYLTQLHDGGET